MLASRINEKLIDWSISNKARFIRYIYISSGLLDQKLNFGFYL